MGRDCAAKAMQLVESEALRYEAQAMDAEDVRAGRVWKRHREWTVLWTNEATKQAQCARDALSRLYRASLDALRSFTFFDSVCKLVVKPDLYIQEESLQCAICFEAFNGSEALLRCGHLFCADCVERALKLGRHACPLCREPIDKRGVIDVEQLREELPEEQRSASSSIDVRKYGSKLQAIVRALEEVQAEQQEA